MIPDSVTPIDEVVLAALLAEDQALAAGVAATDGTTVGLETLGELRDCLVLLEAVWPRSGRVAPPPERLGRFEVVREIGRGGFGVVYLARDPLLGRLVALKVPRPEFLVLPEVRTRLLREARAAGGFDHPNIVRVYEAGEEGSLCYIASAYHAGPTLSAWLKARSAPLPARQAAHVVASMAQAVQHAHDHGVLHRDIKPSNVLLRAVDEPCPEQGPVPLLTDFGLARLIDTEEAADLTRSGVPLGSPPYMSPEQAAGKSHRVGTATDVYGLGAVLYELLAGRPPFKGETAIETIHQVLQAEPVGLRQLRPGLPRDLETICLKCLEKDPARRYPSAAALAEDLNRFLEGRVIQARPATVWEKGLKWARRSPWRAAGLATSAAVLAALVVGMAWSNAWLRRHNDRLEQEMARADWNARLARRHLYAAQLRLAREAIDKGQAERAQNILEEIQPEADGFDPRGFAWHYLRRLARQDVSQLRGHDHDIASLAVAPDGHTLASTDSGGTLLLWNLADGKPSTLLDGTDVFADRPTFSPDGRQLGVLLPNRPNIERSGMAVWDVAARRLQAQIPRPIGATPESLGFLDSGRVVGTEWSKPDTSRFVLLWSKAEGNGQFHASARLDGLNWAAFAPGGRTFVTCQEGKMTLRDPATGAVRHPLVTDGPAHFCAFSPDGQAVAAVVSERFVTLHDADTGAKLGEFDVGAPVVRLALTTGATDVAAVDASGLVHLLRRSNGPRVTIEPDDLGRQRSVVLAFSPDGRWLALSSYGHPGGQAPIAVWDVATGRRVYEFPGRKLQVGTLEFSTDNRHLFLDGGSTVRCWSLARVRETPTFAGHADEAWSVAFSPDGRIMATGSDDTGITETLKLWDVASGRLLAVWHAHPATVSTLSFHPGGRLLASGGLERFDNVRLWDVPTRSLVADLRGHTDRVRAVEFSPDGATLASAGSDQTVRLWDLARHEARAVLKGHSDAVRWLAFSPDGRTLASAANDRTVRLWDVGAKRPSRVFRGTEKFSGVAFSPDGATIAACDEGGLVTFWDAATGRKTSLIHSDDDELRTVAYSPDGRNIAVGGSSRLIRVWDALTGQELLVLAGHRAAINDLAFSPDGLLLASVSHDGEVRVWDARP